MLLKVAWRNIWRNRSRSGVVIASVAVGLFAGMFMMAFFEGVIKQEINSAVETQLSHIQIHNPFFIDDKDINFAIANGQQIVDSLKKDSAVKGASARVITTGMVSSSTTAAGIEIHGIVPSDEKNVSNISQNIIEGSYFGDGKKNEIVIGKKLAEKLGVKLHNKIVLTFQAKTGELTAGSFRIGGIFKTTNSTFDESTAFTQFDDLAQILGTADGVHEIAIMLKDGGQADAVNVQLKKQRPTLLVQTWKEISPEMAIITGTFDQVMYIIIGIILLALMFGIINTMLMAVLERQREFGVLMAIGMNKRLVFSMIVLETVMLTIAGLPIGVLLVISTTGYFGKHGIDLSAFAKGLSQFGLGNMIYPELQSSMFTPVIAMTAITAIVAAIYPAIKALQFSPATAIHKI